MKIFYKIALTLLLILSANTGFSQIVYSGTKTVNSGQNMTLDVFVDPASDSVEIVYTGPVNKWRGIGFGGSSMSGTYALITDGNGNFEERQMGNHNSGTVLSNSLVTTSHTVAGMIATTTVTRSLSGLTADHYTFLGSVNTIPIIWSYGNGVSLAYHAGRGISTISMTQDCSNGATNGSISPVVCETYQSPSGNTYTSTGSYLEILSNSVGCDSVLTINLTVNATRDSIVEMVCAEYTAPSGAVYTTSGFYNDTIPNTAGCDSVITIDLEVQNSMSAYAVVSCGNSFFSQSGNQTWTVDGVYTDTIPNAAGCDSIMAVNLTFADESNSAITITACNQYISDGGVLYLASGTYDEVFTNAAGCDSNVSINLTIVNLDNTVSVLFNDPNFPNHVGEILQANESDASFQWIDCDNNNEAIPGEIDQMFVPSVPGNYAVIINNGNCSDTSDCITVTLLAVEDVNAEQINIFPNPTTGTVNFEISKNSNVSEIQIYSVTGQLIKTVTLNQESKIAVELPNEQGVYFAKIIADGKTKRTVKLIKY